MHGSVETFRSLRSSRTIPDDHTVPPFPADLQTAEISTVDFDLLSTGDSGQCEVLHKAATGYGFFYLKNHHVDHAFMFDLASRVFSLPLDEKMKYDMGTTGHYYGYKKSGAMIVDEHGNKDQSEFYNVSKDEVLGVGGSKEGKGMDHPDVVKARFDELQEFMRACHRIVSVIVDALGVSLGLEKGMLESMHRIDEPSCDQARVTHAPPVSDDTITLGEHTDFGSVTVLFNQLGGLQALAPNRKDWEYVKPRPEYAIINLGDSLVKLVGGRLYSAVHRVVGPPGEQGKEQRHSVVYFSRPNSRVLLRDLFEGEEAEKERARRGEKLMNADEWVKMRAKNWNSGNYKGKESYASSRGTEHNAKRDYERATPNLDRPRNEIEAV